MGRGLTRDDWARMRWRLGDGDAAISVVVGGLKGSSLRTLQLMTGGGMGDKIVQVLLHLFNGRPLAALMHLLGC